MKKTILFGSALLLAASVMLAQPHPEGGPPMHGPGGGPPDGFMGGIEGRTVTGAPFSAQSTSTFSQTLADGSHISRNLTASIARDGQGRTYRQLSMEPIGKTSPGAGKTVIFLRDPVAHTSHVISNDTKTATMMHTPQHDRGHGPRPDGAGGPPPGPRPESRRGRNNETVESLPAQMIEGVWAEGTRITHTIPAGTIGNDHDLKVVSETWYSKELQMVIMSKHSDPRSGESNFKLTNIQRSEPDASLFQVPAGFKVTERGRGR